MKLNNHGWGMREMIIYTCILLLLLLFVSYSVNSFYKEMETSKQNVVNNNYGSDYDDKDEESNVSNNINYIYYHNKEDLIKKATLNYLNNYSYNLDSNIMNVSLDTLINLGYIQKIYDQNNINSCSGYSNVYEDENGEYIIKSYINCGNYVTEGY